MLLLLAWRGNASALQCLMASSLHFSSTFTSGQVDMSVMGPVRDDIPLQTFHI